MRYYNMALAIFLTAMGIVVLNKVVELWLQTYPIPENVRITP